MTTTPTLAAAQEAVRSGLVALPQRSLRRHRAGDYRVELCHHLRGRTARHYRRGPVAAAPAGNQPGGGSGKNGERGEGTTGRPVAGPRLSRDAPGRLRTHHRTNSHAILGLARGSAAATQRRVDYGPATTTTCRSGTRSMPTATPTFSAAASRSSARRSPSHRRSIYPPPIRTW